MGWPSGTLRRQKKGFWLPRAASRPVEGLGAFPPLRPQTQSRGPSLRATLSAGPRGRAGAPAHRPAAAAAAGDAGRGRCAPPGARPSRGGRARRGGRAGGGAYIRGPRRRKPRRFLAGAGTAADTWGAGATPGPEGESRPRPPLAPAGRAHPGSLAPSSPPWGWTAPHRSPRTGFQVWSSPACTPRLARLSRSNG